MKIFHYEITDIQRLLNNLYHTRTRNKRYQNVVKKTISETKEIITYIKYVVCVYNSLSVNTVAGISIHIHVRK